MEGGGGVADYQPARPQGAGEASQEDECPCPAVQLQRSGQADDAWTWLSPEAGRVSPGPDDDPEEAELGASQDRSCSFEQR